MRVINTVVTKRLGVKYIICSIKINIEMKKQKKKGKN